MRLRSARRARPRNKTPAHPAGPFRGAGQGRLTLGALVLLAALAIAPYVPWGVVPASAPADIFSAERALPHARRRRQRDGGGGDGGDAAGAPRRAAAT
jgi:hypothetical protein